MGGDFNISQTEMIKYTRFSLGASLLGSLLSNVGMLGLCCNCWLAGGFINGCGDCVLIFFGGLGLATAVLTEVKVVKTIWQQALKYTGRASPSKESEDFGSAVRSTAIMAGGAWALPGRLLTFGCHPVIMKVTQFFAEKERQCQENIYSALGHKIAKWASLIFATTIGISGAFILGYGIQSALYTWITLPSANDNPYAVNSPHALPWFLAIGAVVFLYEVVHEINKVWQQTYSVATAIPRLTQKREF